MKERRKFEKEGILFLLYGTLFRIKEFSFKHDEFITVSFENFQVNKKEKLEEEILEISKIIFVPINSFQIFS